jgi:hypothetical protein
MSDLEESRHRAKAAGPKTVETCADRIRVRMWQDLEDRVRCGLMARGITVCKP